MLIAKATENQYMKFSHENIFRMWDMPTTLNADVKSHILVVHTFTGCDTLSSLFNQGKQNSITLLTKRSCVCAWASFSTNVYDIKHRIILINVIHLAISLFSMSLRGMIPPMM